VNGCLLEFEGVDPAPHDAMNARVGCGADYDWAAGLRLGAGPPAPPALVFELGKATRA